MPILTLALKSLFNRRYTALLTVIAIALSVALLLGVEKVRTGAHDSFANTISGTDLIVGARTGATQLLLYSVFRIGDATNNISWQSYQELAQHPKIAWTVPISLGDSHRGFRVMGTTPEYFQHYRYGEKRPLEFAAGVPFADLYDAVIGADVAATLDYKIGQRIIIAHGAGDVSFAQHADQPFQVVGILRKTGTPVDRTVHVSLAAIEAVHIGWENGAPLPGLHIGPEQARHHDLTPKTITAFLVGLKSKVATFQVQRYVNDYRDEPLLAILPGVALQQLWDLMGVAERALMIISAFVILVGFTGMLTALLTGLNERRRELAILRSVGARPAQVFGLMMGEALGLTVLGLLFGVGLLYGLLAAAQPWITNHYGLYLPLTAPSNYQYTLLCLVFIAGALIGAIPGYRAYRYSLADGMTIRL